MDRPPLITPADVAARLNIKYRAALELLAPGGALNALRIDIGPKTIRVDPVALEQLISSGGVPVCN